MKTGCLSALALALLGAFAGPGSAMAAEPGKLRLASLGLDVTIDYENERLSGLARIELENVGSQEATLASLLLGRLMVLDDVRDSDDKPMRSRHEVVTFVDSPKKQVNQLLVDLDPPLRPAQRRVLRVRYSGYLVGYVETGSLYIQDHIDKDFVILRADAYAFPVVGVPSWEANKGVAHADFPFDVSVTVPSDQTVASGGVLVDKKVAAGRTTWSYRSTAPAPFLNVAIAHYETIEHDGVRLYAFPKDHDGAARVFDATQRTLALFARWLGPTAAPARFAILEIPDGWGSQASLTGGIIQTSDVFQAGASLQPLYHELSHLWNAPDPPLSCRWNEGLASYLQRRVAAELDGWSGMDADLTKRIARLRDEGRQEPRLATVPFKDYGRELMTDWSYSVGLLMFALLDRVTGPARFNQIVGGFYQANARTQPTNADFSRFVAAHGGRPAEAVVADWLETTRWWARLEAGESLDSIAASYRALRR